MFTGPNKCKIYIYNRESYLVLTFERTFEPPGPSGPINIFFLYVRRLHSIFPEALQQHLTEESLRSWQAPLLPDTCFTLSKRVNIMSGNQPTPQNLIFKSIIIITLCLKRCLMTSCCCSGCLLCCWRGSWCCWQQHLLSFCPGCCGCCCCCCSSCCLTSRTCWGCWGLFVTYPIGSR